MENIACGSGGCRRDPLPPGFKFKPTDEEVVTFYLKKKILNQPFHPSISAMFIDEDIYKFPPNILNEMYNILAFKKGKWFFTPRIRLYEKGKQPTRTVGMVGKDGNKNKDGYWKTTETKKNIFKQGCQEIIGNRRSLVYYSKGGKTKWMMKEYTLEGYVRPRNGLEDMKLDDHVLCRIYQKDQSKKKNTTVKTQSKRKNTTDKTQSSGGANNDKSIVEQSCQLEASFEEEVIGNNHHMDSSSTELLYGNGNTNYYNNYQMERATTNGYFTQILNADEPKDKKNTIDKTQSLGGANADEPTIEQSRQQEASFEEEIIGNNHHMDSSSIELLLHGNGNFDSYMPAAQPLFSFEDYNNYQMERTTTVHNSSSTNGYFTRLLNADESTIVQSYQLETTDPYYRNNNNNNNHLLEMDNIEWTQDSSLLL